MDLSYLFTLDTLLRIVALVIGITVHEASHATSALLLGDDTAQREGRVSLNPLRHLDPVGSLMMIIGIFGWGRPTPVAVWRLKYGPRIGTLLTSGAGPISNLVVAFITALIWRVFVLLMPAGTNMGKLPNLFAAIIFYNLALCIFNLLPISPLDGAAVLLGLVPRDVAASLDQIEQYGPFLLFILIAGPLVLPGLIPNLIGDYMLPLLQTLYTFLGGPPGIFF